VQRLCRFGIEQERIVPPLRLHADAEALTDLGLTGLLGGGLLGGPREIAEGVVQFDIE
jgi:hypothetical protein